MTTNQLKTPIQNGYVYEKYKFTQTLNDLTITIPYTSQIRGKDVNCKITNDSLLVQIKGETIINGKLKDLVKKSDCCWTIEDRKTVVIDLVKQKKMEWWSCAIVGDDEIDIKKVSGDVISDISEFDDDTKEVVQKMMFDEQQKQQGLPTIDQMKRNEILEKFKKEHPEMDFSEAKIMD